MKRIIIWISLPVLALASCKQNSRKDTVVGKWLAVKVENPAMDSFFARSKAMIDTIGKGNDAATNLRLYGIANMDSMREIMRLQYDSVKKEQYGAVNNTTYWFRKDSVAIIMFAGNTDSSRWHIDSKGKLVLEEFAKDGNDKISMDIVTLTGTELKLRFAEDEDTSVVTFRREIEAP